MLTRSFALLGEKLGHSLSVPIHRRVYELMGWPGTYSLREIPREAFPHTAGMIRRENLGGVNVTIPYKVEIMAQLDEVDPFAREVGAVNTVACLAGRLTGYNTDVYGLMEMLRFHGLIPQGNCCVLGSGGAARSACAALKALGAGEITVISRTPEKRDWGQDLIFKGYEALETMEGSLMINATPVGMYPHPEACPVTLKQMQGFTAFGDLIYNPGETLFIRRARQMNRPGSTGLYMLVAQAVRAEEIWWQKDIPARVTQTIYEEMQKEMRL